MIRLPQALRHLPPGIWPWSLTAVALLVAACAALWLTPQWQQQATAYAAAAARAQQLALAARHSDRARTNAWREDLATAAQRDARLAALLDAATAANVSLLSAEQAGAEPAVGGVSRLRLNLGLRGHYAELRRFVEDVLRSDPGLAVEHISFNRSRTEDPLLEARVQLSLLQREAVEALR